MATMAIAALEKKVAKDTIDQAHQLFGLDYVEVASALGVDRRTIFRYRTDGSVPSPDIRARLGKIREIAHLLNAVFASHDAQLQWLYSPVPLLRGRRPIDLIRQGELDEVLSVLAGVYTGAAS
jgi:putative toxin-antitoxin system antitoxin component (TIGR02293 family)